MRFIITGCSWVASDTVGDRHGSRSLHMRYVGLQLVEDLSPERRGQDYLKIVGGSSWKICSEPAPLDVYYAGRSPCTNTRGIRLVEGL